MSKDNGHWTTLDIGSGPIDGDEVIPCPECGIALAYPHAIPGFKEFVEQAMDGVGVEIVDGEAVGYDVSTMCHAFIFIGAQLAMQLAPDLKAAANTAAQAFSDATKWNKRIHKVKGL